MELEATENERPLAEGYLLLGAPELQELPKLIVFIEIVAQRSSYSLNCCSRGSLTETAAPSTPVATRVTVQ